MSIRRAAGSAHPAYPPSSDQIQRDHELQRALEAARRLQAWLEILGDRPEAVRSVRALRDDLAGEQILLMGGPPCQDDLDPHAGVITTEAHDR